MLRMTMGQLLVNEALPEDMRDPSRVLDKKGMSVLLRELAQKHPEKYVEVSHKLSNIGRDVATEFGGYSFGLEHLRKAEASKVQQLKTKAQLKRILDNDDLTSEQRRNLIIKTVGSTQQQQIDDIFAEAVKANNPLAYQVVSGSRGNKMNVSSLLGGDTLYADHRDEVIPLHISSSYSQGLKPVEYWAATYGGRRGTLSAKFATRDAGYLSKQLNQISHRLMIIGDDDDKDIPDRGLPVDTDDNDNEGALLAKDVGGYKRNTVLTPKILKHLKSTGNDRILVRSPITSSSMDGGIYARDVGIRERGTLPGRGEQVGLSAAQALSEPLSQGQLCLAKGTLVRMADWSTKAIELVKVGDFVLGSDRTGKTFPVRVSRIYNNGIRECVRTEFGVGQSRERIELLSTPEHKLLATTAKWPFAKTDYTLGVFPVNTKTRYFSALMSTAAEYHAGQFAKADGICPFLLGVLIGDGCYVDSVHGVYLSCFDPLLTAYLNSTPWFESIGIKATKLKGHKGYYRISQVKDTAAHDELGQFTLGTRNPIRKYLEDTGLYGKYAHEKALPNTVWTWRTSDVSMLLAGLFVTDGSVYVASTQQNRSKCYISYCSTSRKLIEQVKALLDFRFAIHSSRIYEDMSARRKRPLYQINITTHTGIRKFNASIRLEGVKKFKLIEALAGWEIERDVDHDKFYRKTQEPVGSLPTFDIEVEHEDHLFVLANGLIVSNSAKHSGGVAGQEKAVGGFAYINQLIQVPKRFRGGAAHAEHDGLVSSIEPAPAGGHYVFIDNERHYVPADVALKVKKGDAIEAGDVLSEGFPNPATVTQYKGIGEGKRYFVNAFRQAMTDAGMKGNRRNIELLARGLINHVRLTDEYGEHVPDDVVPYSTMEHLYEPREGHTVSDPRRAMGQYLERPVLHYSIGTKIRPSVLKELQSFGINEVTAHPEPPPFQAEMIRGMASLQNDPDWMTRMYGSGLKGSLLDATHRGAVSDELGTSFVPGLARGVDFGRVGAVRVPEKGTASLVEGQPFGDPRKPLDLPAQDKKKAIVPKQSGLFSGLFKTSEELEKEAFAFLKMAGPIKATVDTTTPSSTGSSTAAPATQAVAKPGAMPSTNIMPSAAPKPPSTPSTNIMSGGSNNLTTSTLPQPAPTASAPAGQVHPARLQDSWGTPKPFNPQAGMGQNPNAFSGGYVPTAGLLSQTDSPEMAANFVQGGGNPNDPSSGYGGQFGAVARFGSLMDMGAVAALTSGSDYVPGQYNGNGQHDDLLGGAESSKVHDWNAPKAVTPKAVSPLVKPQVNQVLATQGMQNPNHLTESLSTLKGWKPGNAEFDALKAKTPNAPDSEIQKQLFNSAKRGVLLSKQGYTPGKPQFEAVRKKLSDEVLAGATVDQKISEAESGIAALQATNPADPQIAKFTEYLQHLREFKEKGIPDSDVFAHIKENIEPTGDMTDYEVLQTIRGNNDTSHLLTKTFTSPVTGAAAQKAVTSGMYHTLKNVPLVNKLPGLRAPVPPVPGAGQVLGEAGQAGLKQGEKVVAKQIFKETEEAAVKLTMKQMAAKGVRCGIKKIPGIGWALEVYDAADTPEDELRAKFNSKLMGISGDPSLGDAGMYLLDNALNPGQNVRAAAIVAQDANAMLDKAEDTGLAAEANRVAQRMAHVQYLERVSASRQLTQEERVKLDTHKKAIAAAYKAQGSLPTDDSAFKGLVNSRRNDAIKVTERARQQVGQNALDKILAGTATPFEQDGFKEWLEAQKSVESPRTEGGYTEAEHNNLNSQYQQYVDMAIKLSEKGRTEEAKILMAKADSFAPNTAIRNRRAQEQPEKERVARLNAAYEARMQPKPVPVKPVTPLPANLGSTITPYISTPPNYPSLGGFSGTLTGPSPVKQINLDDVNRKPAPRFGN